MASPPTSSLPAATKYKLKDVKSLGRQLLTSTAHINNLPLLLPFVSPSFTPSFALESLLSLHSFFVPLLPLRAPPRARATDGGGGGSAEDDAEAVYLAWLLSRFDEFVTALVAVVVAGDAEETLREIVLDTIMELVKMGKGGKFQSAIYNQLMRAIVHSSTVNDFAVEYLSSKYFKYIDVRYFTYISLEKLCRNLEEKYLSGEEATVADGEKGNQSEAMLVCIEHSIYKVHHIISEIPPLNGVNNESAYEMWSGPVDNGTSKPSNEVKEQLKGEKRDSGVLTADKVVRKMKLKFTKAWIAFLRLPLPLDVYKEVLVSLHQIVIAHLSNPLMLCDFLTRSYDIGGVVSVLALSSLFILMTEHGLECPDFYGKLYALLQPSIFIAKHRARFFELLDSCLKSPLLPAYLAAAFTKKLSRLALSVPPPGALIIVALIHNLLRRHPTINCLVHREDGGSDFKDQSKADEENFGNGNTSTGLDSSKRPGFDHFQADELNPIKTSAMKSSLWEIDTLRHHYCPPVSRFILSLENDLTVRAKTTEISVKDFSSGSYGTIFRNEMRRRVKQVPLAFYKAIPTTLFLEADFPGWTFETEKSDNLNSNSAADADGRPREDDHDRSVKRQRMEL